MATVIQSPFLIIKITFNLIISLHNIRKHNFL